MITSMNIINLFQGLSIYLFVFVFFILLFSLYVIKNKKFISNDKKPELLPIALLSRRGELTNAVQVKTGIFIKSFPAFDMTKGSFILDAIVWFEFNKSLISLEGIDNFTFENARAVKKSTPEMHLVNSNRLLVKYNVQIDFSANLDNQFFPMNDHQLFIVLTNEHFLPQEVVFDVKTSYFNCSEDLNTQDLYVYSKHAESGYISIFLKDESNQQILYPRVIYTLNMKKTGLRKVALIIMPVMLILFLSSTSVLPGLEANSLSIAVGCLTGMLGYRFVIYSVSPNVGYFTLAEHIYNMALTLVFFTFTLVLNRMFVKFLPFGVDEGIIWFMLVIIIMTSWTYYLLFRWNPHININNDIYGLVNTLRDQPSHQSKKYQKITLSDFITNMHAVSQHVPPDNNDPINPEYTGYYQKFRVNILKRAWFSRLKTSLYCCSPIFIIELLMAISSIYPPQDGALDDTGYIVKIPVYDDSNVIIFGDVSGDFHALGHHLLELNKMGILSEDLQLTRQNDRIIFNGNVINGSPHLLETLSLVMILLLKNPNRVFYIRGEKDSCDSDVNPAIDLEIKCKLSNINENTLNATRANLDRFLASLPLAIYLQNNEQEKTNIVRISSDGIEKTNKKDDLFKLFLKKESGGIESFSLNVNEFPCEFTSGVSLDAIIQKPDTFDSIYAGKTLALLTPDKGVMTWGICSSFRLLDQSNTGFVILKTRLSAKNWQFHVYQQPRDNLHDYSVLILNMMYGYKINDPTELPVTKHSVDDFILSSTMDLSQTISIFSRKLSQGLYTKLIEQNGTGGINGRLLRLIVSDDKFIPALAKKNILDNINHYQSSIVISPVGTPTLEAYSNLILDKKIVVMFPISGGSILRRPEYENVVFLRASFSQEGHELIEYAVNKNERQRLAIFYQNDAYGLGSLSGVKQMLDNIQVDWLPVPYQRNNPNVEECALKIMNFNADAILFFAKTAAAIGLIHKLGISYVANISLIAGSNGTTAFHDFLQSMNLKLIKTRLVPPLNTDIQIVREYHQSIKNEPFSMRPSDDSLEGYINMSVLSYFLESIDPPITREKLLERIRASTQPFNYKGLPLQLNPLTRELYNGIWIEDF